MVKLVCTGVGVARWSSGARVEALCALAADRVYVGSAHGQTLDLTATAHDPQLFSKLKYFTDRN